MVVVGCGGAGLAPVLLLVVVVVEEAAAAAAETAGAVAGGGTFMLFVDVVLPPRPRRPWPHPRRPPEGLAAVTGLTSGAGFLCSGSMSPSRMSSRPPKSCFGFALGAVDAVPVAVAVATTSRPWVACSCCCLV